MKKENVWNEHFSIKIKFYNLLLVTHIILLSTDYIIKLFKFNEKTEN